MAILTIVTLTKITFSRGADRVLLTECNGEAGAKTIIHLQIKCQEMCTTSM